MLILIIYGHGAGGFHIVKFRRNVSVHKYKSVFAVKNMDIKQLQRRLKSLNKKLKRIDIIVRKADDKEVLHRCENKANKIKRQINYATKILDEKKSVEKDNDGYDKIYSSIPGAPIEEQIHFMCERLWRLRSVWCMQKSDGINETSSSLEEKIDWTRICIYRLSEGIRKA